ncbi:hypothetical protein Pmar_PMAR022351 [Perkinsus marinus ATCC 50983]|uniref:Secreted protein n=1 Tax=Perkinsus marinus (strain ATCC 50983 / TXsc) TaxID=423536 RepID=C5KDU8_PERM5|nr:hypothetical protein Pmar_PMAR022351 [Perkinsus marinus ATCC 50983]EER17401.1 hypothetical protein Pmar_PMAR022351 [Perkinsus marinus ATCC 50983]|eukprot:XP_002785605.1 hypothetical protein Pmar_PMAR022351 [Perkinsus marinus ATCC 50983]
MPHRSPSRFCLMIFVHHCLLVEDCFHLCPGFCQASAFLSPELRRTCHCLCPTVAPVFFRSGVSFNAFAFVPRESFFLVVPGTINSASCLKSFGGQDVKTTCSTTGSGLLSFSNTASVGFAASMVYHGLLYELVTIAMPSRFRQSYCPCSPSPCSC